MAEITFRAHSPDDAPLLWLWLNRPHLRAFYQKTPIALEAVQAKYGAYARGERPTAGHIASVDGRPFGYLQSYRNRDWPDWAALIACEGGMSIDLFIGEPDHLGQGLGRAMLAAYVENIVFAPGSEGDAYIAHETANVAAVACSHAAGFEAVRPFVEDGAPIILMRRVRPR